jgi:hypothetical protein
MQVKANYPLSIPDELEKNPERLNPDRTAKVLGKPTGCALQQASWLKGVGLKLIS